MNKKTISLCMIVKNEEKFLEQCLKSIQNKVDEIIIVDTGSTDSTIEIAEKFNAKIYTFEWVDDFSVARNFSIEKATADYVLVMDADEYLDEASNLYKVVESEKDYYTIRTKNHLSSGNSFYHPSIRLFRNFAGLQYRGKIHEHLNVEDPSMNLSNEFGDVLLHHVGYLVEIVQEKNKHERNIKLLLEEVEKSPTGYNFYNLANQYNYNQQYEEAVEAYKKAFNLSKDRAFIINLLYNMTDSLAKLKRFKEALDVLDGCIESFPQYTDFYFMKGKIFEQLEDYLDAENMFKKCIELGEVKFIQSMEGVGTFQSYVRLGNIYCERGELVQAFEMAFEALKVSKHYLPAVRLYLETMIKTKIPQSKIQEQLELVYPIQKFEDLKSLVWVLSVMKNPLAYQYIQKYQLKVDPSVRMNSLLYSKQYDEPKNFWALNPTITQSDLFDIAFLAFIEKDSKWLEPFMPRFNFNQKDQKLLKAIIRKEDFTFHKTSEDFDKVILFIIEHLLKLAEFAEVDYFLGKLDQVSFEFRLKMCKLFYSYGYVDIAQKILLNDFPHHSSNKDLLELLGDVCVKLKQYEEAKSFYIRILAIDPKYKIYEKLYFIGEKLGSNEFCTQVKKEIEDNFPLVEWVKK